MVAVEQAAPSSAETTAVDRRRRWVPIALGAWAGLLLVARVWGDRLVEEGQRIKLSAPPLVARPDWRVTWRLLVPLGVAALVIAYGPRLAQRLDWRRLLVAAFVAAGAWALALAFVDGVSGILFSQEHSPSEYLLDAPNVGAIGPFLDTFTERIDDFVNHVRAHPPGMVVILALFDRVGLGGPGWASALYIGGGAAAIPAVLVAVRDVAGDGWARRSVPWLVLAPAAIWIATSADAFFAGVGAWAVALVVLATGASGRREHVLAFAGGLLFGASLMLSYGLALLAIPMGVGALTRRRLSSLVIAAAATLAVLGAFALAGFSWIEGWEVTRREYRESIASTRPYWYFAVANLAALGLAVGPAVAAGFARLRDRRMWAVLGGFVAAVVAAEISGLSKGEVERIWLPFSVWLLAAAAVWSPALVSGGSGAGSAGAGRLRLWLAAQAGVAILVETAVRTAW